MRNQKLLETFDKAFEPLDIAERISSIEDSRGMEGVAEFHEQFPDFNLCFLSDSSKYILKYVNMRSTPYSIKSLFPGYIIGRNTSLLELAKILMEKEFTTILEQDKVEWLVTWQDLNKAPFTDWVFSHISLLERNLKEKIKSDFENPYKALDLLKSERQSMIFKCYESAKRANRDTHIIDCFYLIDVLVISIEQHWLNNLYGEETKPRKQMSFAYQINKTRNSITHSNHIFKTHADLKKQVKLIETLRNLLLNL